MVFFEMPKLLFSYKGTHVVNKGVIPFSNFVPRVYSVILSFMGLIRRK